MSFDDDGSPSRAVLEQMHCWEPEDGVPGRHAMTAFCRRVRLEQAWWRESNGHPIGTQPIRPIHDRPVRSVGSRLPLDYARQTGANFLTDAARSAAHARTLRVETHQTLDRQRVWADLLSSLALAINLFGDLADDLDAADAALHKWLPGTPGRVRDVRFAYSPGRLDPTYLNSLRMFDTAFLLGLDDGTSGIVAVSVKYREANKAETPRPENDRRYRAVAAQARVFQSGAIDELARRGDLCTMWLEHLLVHAMVQHPSKEWRWGRYIVLHHPDNSDIVDASNRYRKMLADHTTFTATSIDRLIDSAVLPTTAASAIEARYRFGTTNSATSTPGLAD